MTKRTPFAKLFGSVGTAIALFAVGLPAQSAPIEVAEVQRAEPVDFEREILPLFKRSCLACHNATDAEADIVLETPQTIAKGVNSSEEPLVKPGKGMESSLLRIAAHIDEPIMPPEDNDREATNFSPQELGLLKLWIDQGAKGEVTGTGGPVAWQPLPTGVNPIYSVAMTSDGQFVACGRANQIFVYHVPTGALVTRLTDPALKEMVGEGRSGIAHLDLVESLAFSPDGEYLASGAFRSVKLWRRPSSVKAKEIAGAAGDEILAVAVSPDKKWLATASKDKNIKLFNNQDGQPGPTLSGHGEAVTDLQFNADGTQLVSVSADKTVRLWNLADGKELGQIETPAPLNAVALAAEKQVAVGAADNNIYVYPLPGQPEAADAETTEAEEGDAAEEGIKPLQELKGHSQPVTSLEPYPGDPNQVVSGSADGTVRIWNVTNAQNVRSMNHGGPVTDVAARPDGQRIASVSENNIVKLWNSADGKQLAEVKGDVRTQRAEVRATRQLDKKKNLVARRKRELEAAEKDLPTKQEAHKKAEEAVAEAEKALKEKQEALKAPQAEKEKAEKELADFEAALKKAQEVLEKAKAELEKDKENEDKKKAVAEAEKAVADADKKVKDQQKVVQDATKKFTDAEQMVKGAERTLDGSKKSLELAASDLKKATDLIPQAKALMTTAENEQKEAEGVVEEAKKKVAESEKPFRSVAFSPDNLYFAAGSDNGLVHLYDAAAGTATQVLEGQGGPVQALVYTSENLLASGSADKSAIVWNTNPEWELVTKIGNPDRNDQLVDRVMALTFDPAGQMLATGGGEPSRSGELKIWSVPGGELVREIPDAHSDTVFGLEFSRDGEYLASCGADKFVKVWNAKSGEFVRSFEGHTHHVMGVSWQADGLVLASAGADNVIKVWDSQTGDQQRTIQGFNKQVTAVQFIGLTGDVLSSSGDKNVRRHTANNGRNVRTFSGGTDYMYAVAITPNGKIVAAGGQDSVLRLWDGDNGQALHTFEPPQPAEPAETAQAASGE